MKKEAAKAAQAGLADMRAEYDFSGAIRGKYAKRVAKGTNVVLLDPDVAEVFPDSASVNRATSTSRTVSTPRLVRNGRTNGMARRNTSSVGWDIGDQASRVNT